MLLKFLAQTSEVALDHILSISGFPVE